MYLAKKQTIVQKGKYDEALKARVMYLSLATSDYLTIVSKRLLFFVQLFVALNRL